MPDEPLPNAPVNPESPTPPAPQAANGQPIYAAPPNLQPIPQPVYGQPGTVPPTYGQPTNPDESSKGYVITWVLSYFLGGLGVDRFYLGRIPTGVVKLLTGGGLGVWSLIDLFLIAFGKLKSTDGKYLAGYQANNKIIKIITVVLGVLGLLVTAGIVLALVVTTYNGIQQKSLDTERTVDLKAIQAQLEGYHAQNGYYPSFTDLNSPQFRTANFAGLDDQTFKDPRGIDSTLVPVPIPHAYSYVVSPEGCGDASLRCTSYSLGTIESNGTDYEVSSLH